MRLIRRAPMARPPTLLIAATAAIALAALNVLFVGTPVRTAHAAAGEVVMLGFDTDTPLSSGLEDAFVAAGKTVVVMSPSEWNGMTQSQFDAYDAVVIGDPTCSSFANGIDVKAAVWGPIVDGNVIVIGTDEQFHDSQGGQDLMNSAAAFTVALSGTTGAYVSMSCGGTEPGAQAALSAAFSGTWTPIETECGTNVKIVATHPALAGLTDATLSGWNCSTHNAFSAWPLDFEVLAMALEGAFFTAPDGTLGSPYILARGVTVISDIDLAPETSENPIGTSHTLTATVSQGTPPAPVVGTTVTFTVVGGPHTGTTGTGVTNATGQATFAYAGSTLGTDTIEATFVDTTGATQRSNRVTKTWVAAKLTPTVATTIHNAAHGAVTTVVAGTTVHDSVTVTGSGAVPTGNVTVSWFTNGTCAGAAAATSAATLLVGGTVDVTGFTQTPAAVGSFAFRASYAGDSVYAPATGPCETLAVTASALLTPTVATTIHNAAHGAVTTVVAGTTVHDSVTVTGSGAVPTGNVTVSWFTNGTCAGAAAATSAATLLVGGTVDVTGFTQTPAAVGSFAFRASYAGDSVYAPATGPCETLAVTASPLLTPTVATTIHNAAHGAVTTVVAGTTVHDSVTVTGSGAVPTGNVTISWFTNGTCASTAAATSAATPLVGGTVDVTGFTQTPAAVGSFAFRASYAGDSVYAPATGPCETLTVTSSDGPVLDKEACKKGGWLDFIAAPGPFRNQGNCVSHFARAMGQ